jgi:hypothetical protein
VKKVLKMGKGCQRDKLVTIFLKNTMFVFDENYRYKSERNLGLQGYSNG